ncbi:MULTISPECIES: hypothetical protein [Deinococcus]|uniref:VRR-NUC domain-containing protein n=1 Tax=Deinococcus rufus TaxID=2136097 RepID=A0ABV7ZDQ6_9DEIO|nr:hypothetical protein [Deinococcus sp. AB2017081]WQE94064.1 hypothetical protein U2P90_11655 [Deinococcus sp. AB2017081]
MTRPPASEAQVEAAISDLFLRAGWYPVKTDAALVTRGSRRRVKSGHIPSGFPDMTYLLGLPGTGLCLAALIETKTATGQARDSQVERHAELRDLYGIAAHIVRDPREAAALIAMARRVVGALKGVTLS